MNRDPHLPPPEVCDWLLSQDRGELLRETHVSYSNSDTKSSVFYNHYLVRLEIGSDGANQGLLIADDVLQVLKDDQEARRQALEQKRRRCEVDELSRREEREAQRVCETFIHADARDPHLPPPEVCDWLLAMNWSSPDSIPLSSDGKNQDGHMVDGCQAEYPIGRNGSGVLLLDHEDLRVLREDVKARQADAYQVSEPDQHPDDRLVSAILEAIETFKPEPSAVAAAGAAFAAGTLMVNNHYRFVSESTSDEARP